MTAGPGARRRLLRPSGFWSASSAWRRFGRRTAAAATATAPLVTVIAGLVSLVRELMTRDAVLVTPDGPLFATVGGILF
jgi:hypothetical protein